MKQTVGLLTTVLVLELSCSYQARPPAGGLMCAAIQPGANRCPDGYGCFKTPTGKGCLDTCWPVLEPPEVTCPSPDGSVWEDGAFGARDASGAADLEPAGGLGGAGSGAAGSGAGGGPVVGSGGMGGVGGTVGTPTGGSGSGGAGGGPGAKPATGGAAGGMVSGTGGGSGGMVSGTGGTVAGTGGAPVCGSYGQACCAGSTCNTSPVCPGGGNCLVCGVAAQCLRIDQQQTMNPSGGPIGGQSHQKLAQVITVGASGKLVELRLPVSCAPASAITVQIQGVTSGGTPDGNVLATRQIQPAETTGFQGFPLTAPLMMNVGTKFALVLTSAGDCGIGFGPTTDGYPGGQMYFDAAPNPPGWVTSERDLAFQTLIAP